MAAAMAAIELGQPGWLSGRKDGIDCGSHVARIMRSACHIDVPSCHEPANQQPQAQKKTRKDQKTADQIKIHSFSP